MHQVGGAGLAGEIRGAGAGVELHLVLVADHRRQCDGERAVADVHQRVNALPVHPFAGNGQTDVDLVLVVGDHDLHVDVAGRNPGVLDGLADAGLEQWAAKVAVGAGHVGEDAELDYPWALGTGCTGQGG